MTLKLELVISSCCQGIGLQLTLYYDNYVLYSRLIVGNVRGLVILGAFILAAVLVHAIACGGGYEGI